MSGCRQRWHGICLAAGRGQRAAAAGPGEAKRDVTKAIPILLALLVLGASMPSLASPEQGAAQRSDVALDRARASLQKAQGRLAAIRAEQRSKAALHGRLVARIEELKRGPIQAFRLEALQRSARAMAEEQVALQHEAEQSEQEVLQRRTELRDLVQQRLRDLEAQPPDDPDAKLGWVKRQEELLGLLQQLQPAGAATPLPAVPPSEYSAADGPEELQEMADELADIGEQYLARAAALAQRIGELLKQQRLTKLAQDLAREEGLFDEAVRYRKVGRLTLVQRQAGQGGHAGSSEGSGSGDGGGNGTGVSSGGGGIGSGNDPGEPSGGQHGEQPPPGSHGGRDNGEYDGDEHTWHGDATADPAIPEISVLDPAASDPGGVLDGRPDPLPAPSFEARLGIKEDLDPRIGVADLRALNGLELNGQLQLLERERSAAASKGQQLLRQAEEFRQRARQLRRQEGF